jgi:tetratricopeptide (TPR) repeat protein
MQRLTGRLGTAKTGLIATWLCFVGLMAGCGGGGGGGGPDAASLTAEGWALYEAGHYSEAIGKFDAAVEADPSYADAYNGLGWTYGKLDSLDEALANFDLCLAKGDARPDPYAGKAPVLRDIEPAQYENAIVAALAALARDSDFEFEHYEDFDWRDLRIIMAQCYFEIEDYGQAHAQVDILDPGNTLNPSSETWPAELAAAIEDLEEDFGG